jgi:hypothetical protein
VLHDTVPCCAMLRCAARCRRLGEPHRGAERRPHDRHTGRTLHLPKYLRARQAQCEVQEAQQVLLFRLVTSTAGSAPCTGLSLCGTPSAS